MWKKKQVLKRLKAIRDAELERYVNASRVMQQNVYVMYLNDEDNLYRMLGWNDGCMLLYRKFIATQKAINKIHDL